MREIKFRGQSINGEWYYGLLSISQDFSGQPEKGYFISNDSGMPWAYQVRPETIGVYIGLLDKTGKEIYEGDILDVGCNPYFGLYIVKYGEYKLKDQTKDDRQKYHLGFYLESLNGFHILSLLDVIKGDDLQPFYGRSKSYGEIIGNIHKNPELLEDNND